MKKKFLFGFALLFAVILSSCSPNTPVDDDPYSGNTDTWSYKYTISEPDWAYSSDTTYAYVSLEVPEINDNVVDKGTVLVQIQDANNNDWYAVPFSSVPDPVVKDNNGNIIGTPGYQQVYGTSYTRGRVTIDLSAVNTYNPSVRMYYELKVQPTNNIKVTIIQPV